MVASVHRTAKGTRQGPAGEERRESLLHRGVPDLVRPDALDRPPPGGPRPRLPAHHLLHPDGRSRPMPRLPRNAPTPSKEKRTGRGGATSAFARHDDDWTEGNDRSQPSAPEPGRGPDEPVGLAGSFRLMVRPEGLEPPTNRSVVCRSIQLSYGRTVKERSAPRGQAAERAGFEPAEQVSPFTRLAGERLRPLGHLSGKGASPWRDLAGSYPPQGSSGRG